MRRILTLIYGIVCYVIFFVTFLYFFGFTGDFLVPKSVSVGEPAENLALALLVNLGLMALFAVQHSVMARPTFKKGWTKWVPQPLERSTYVLISSVALILLYGAWQPMPAEIWNVEGTWLGAFLWALFFIGMIVVFASSFMINHFDLFGLRQTFLYFLGRPYTPVPFKVTGFYRWVRHPLMLGFLLSLWSAPAMTQSRLLWAVGMTVYIFIGIYFEERNTAQYLGESYRRYRSETPLILPLPKK
jgi:protein-S-isoprenylcysteine O-methyltransferase Ste14